MKDYTLEDLERDGGFGLDIDLKPIPYVTHLQKTQLEELNELICTLKNLKIGDSFTVKTYDELQRIRYKSAVLHVNLQYEQIDDGYRITAIGENGNDLLIKHKKEMMELLKKMKSGESFVIKSTSNHRHQYVRYGRELGIKIATRYEYKDHYRVWKL